MTDKVFVGNLPFSASKEDIIALFGLKGNIRGINLRVDRSTGRQRGFGFITYSNSDEAINAVNTLNKYVFHGRVLTVGYAEKRGGYAVNESNKPNSNIRQLTSSSRTAKEEGKKSWTEWS